MDLKDDNAMTKNLGQSPGVAQSVGNLELEIIRLSLEDPLARLRPTTFLAFMFREQATAPRRYTECNDTHVALTDTLQKNYGNFRGCRQHSDVSTAKRPFIAISKW